MEITLNLVWAVLAAACVCLWVRTERRTGAERHLPLIALTMLIVMLFPVISVSDDLWAQPNPAETDSNARRNELVASPHSLFPVCDALIEPFLAELSSGPQQSTVRTSPKVRAIASPVRHRLRTRPPPAA